MVCKARLSPSSPCDCYSTPNTFKVKVCQAYLSTLHLDTKCQGPTPPRHYGGTLIFTPVSRNRKKREIRLRTAALTYFPTLFVLAAHALSTCQLTKIGKYWGSFFFGLFSKNWSSINNAPTSGKSPRCRHIRAEIR